MLNYGYKIKSSIDKINGSDYQIKSRFNKISPLVGEKISVHTHRDLLWFVGHIRL